MFGWTFYRNSIGVAVLLYGSTAWSVETVAADASKESSARTTITAQTMTVHNQERKAVFEGTVVLRKGSLVVHSDTMVVLFRPTTQESPEGRAEELVAGHRNDAVLARQPSRSGTGALPMLSNHAVSTIEATGRVRIEKAHGRATCRKAVYYQDQDKIVLTGDPVAWQRGTRVAGQKITIFLAEDRSVVEGGSRMTIAPDGEEGRR